MLAIADKNGEVAASIPGLARLAGVPLKAVEKAIEKFLSPDKHSRTKDDQGRRIEEIDGGWSLLNHSKYREMASKDEAKTSNAERQQRFKERKRRNALVTVGNGQVTHDRDIADPDAPSHSEAEADSARVKGQGCVPHSWDSLLHDGTGSLYPTSDDQMYDALEAAGIDSEPDKEGNFLGQMINSGWTIRGERIFDWKKAYVGRIEHNTSKDQYT